MRRSGGDHPLPLPPPLEVFPRHHANLTPMAATSPKFFGMLEQHPDMRKVAFASSSTFSSNLTFPLPEHERENLSPTQSAERITAHFAAISSEYSAITSACQRQTCPWGIRTTTDN